MTEAQKALNREKSKTRVRVEHIFGFMKNSMNGMYFKVIGDNRPNEPDLQSVQEDPDYWARNGIGVSGPQRETI